MHVLNIIYIYIVSELIIIYKIIIILQKKLLRIQLYYDVKTDFDF